MFANDRETSFRSRRNLAAATVATLGFTLAVAIGPAVGANQAGGAPGNSGTLKVRDAATGREASEQNNEAIVCDFWLEFSYSAPTQDGTWQVLSWPPTGDGSVMASGAYDTTGDGVDTSPTIHLAPGHYRVEWLANGSHSSKNKTIWVDGTCDTIPATPAQQPSQGEDPSQVADPSQAGDPSPAEQPSQVADPSQAGDPSPAEQPSQVEQPGAVGGDPGADGGVLENAGAGASGANVPDTAVPTPSGLTATLSVLLVIIGHSVWRRRTGLARE
jgi:hypothetical protein